VDSVTSVVTDFSSLLSERASPSSSRSSAVVDGAAAALPNPNPPSDSSSALRAASRRSLRITAGTTIGSPYCSCGEVRHPPFHGLV
jgi:hypothetical protein